MKSESNSLFQALIMDSGIMRTQSSVEQTVLFWHNKQQFRIHIVDNPYDFQSSAKLEMLSDSGWFEIVTLNPKSHFGLHFVLSDTDEKISYLPIMKEMANIVRRFGNEKLAQMAEQWEMIQHN